MASPWLLATQFAAAGLMLALAAWLAWLDIRSRAVRAFAAYLVLRAGLILSLRIASLADAPDVQRALDATFAYYDLALPFVLAYFLSVYPRPRGPFATRAGALTLLAAGLAAELAYALDHCLVVCDASADVLDVGPLAPLAVSSALVACVGALVLARDAARASPGHRRVSLLLMSAGFLLAGVVDAGVFLASLVRDSAAILAAYKPEIWSYILLASVVLGVVPAAAAVVTVARGATPREAARYAGWGAAALATGLVVGAVPLAVGQVLSQPILGAWRLALPLLVGYALVRHRVFDLDARATWTLSRGTTGGIILVVFIVVSEIAANYVSDRVGSYFGFAAAGVLVLMIVPLQHFAEKLVKRALGDPQPIEQVPEDDRLDVYRQQATRVLRRGAVSDKDRRFLDDLRDHLRIPRESAARIEQESQLTFARQSPTEVRT